MKETEIYNLAFKFYFNLNYFFFITQKRQKFNLFVYFFYYQLQYIQILLSLALIV